MINKPEKTITIEDLYPDLSPEDGAEAKENLREYVRIVWKIYNRLKAENKLEEVLLRSQWEKRSQHKHESHNHSESEDDNTTTNGSSNELSS